MWATAGDCCGLVRDAIVEETEPGGAVRRNKDGGQFLKILNDFPLWSIKYPFFFFWYGLTQH